MAHAHPDRGGASLPRGRRVEDKEDDMEEWLGLHELLGTLEKSARTRNARGASLKKNKLKREYI